MVLVFTVNGSILFSSEQEFQKSSEKSGSLTKGALLVFTMWSVVHNFQSKDSIQKLKSEHGVKGRAYKDHGLCQTARLAGDYDPSTKIYKNQQMKKN